MSTSLPSVSQVELLKLFGPERPELDLATEVSCDDDLQPQIFFVVKDFLVSPPSLVLHILQRPDPRAHIPVQFIIADLQQCASSCKVLVPSGLFLSVYLDVSTSGLVAHVDCRSHLEQTIVTIQDWSTGGWQQVDT